jgi:hypothetical protein
MSMGVLDDMGIAYGTDALMYRGQVGIPYATWRLVDRRVSSVPLGGRMLAGVGPMPS